MEDNNRNAFIDNGGLSKSTSLTHLLNKNDNMDSDNIEVIEHSPYYSEADFQNVLKLNNTFIIMSLNCQSINAKFDKIQLFNDRINKSGSLGMLCLQESWIDMNEDISLFELPGYTLYHQGKQCCKNRGLLVYVHNRYKVEPLNINFQPTKWEGYCLKVSQTHPYPKHYVITNIYCPPCETLDDFNLFNAEFDTFVSTISEIGYPSNICGDFNINLLKIHTKTHYNTFFENLLSSVFCLKITLPTRICDTSSTLIDNIFSNVIEPNTKSGILTGHISDHQAIFISTNFKFNKDTKTKYINVETKDDASLNNFINELKNLNLIANMNIEPNQSENPCDPIQMRIM